MTHEHKLYEEDNGAATPQANAMWGKFTLRSDWLDFALRLERGRNEARALAEKYRNLAAGTQQQADDHRLPWETITNQPKQ